MSFNSSPNEIAHWVSIDTSQPLLAWKRKLILDSCAWVQAFTNVGNDEYMTDLRTEVKREAAKGIPNAGTALFASSTELQKLIDEVRASNCPLILCFLLRYPHRSLYL